MLAFNAYYSSVFLAQFLVAAVRSGIAQRVWSNVARISDTWQFRKQRLIAFHTQLRLFVRFDKAIHQCQPAMYQLVPEWIKGGAIAFIDKSVGFRSKRGKEGRPIDCINCCMGSKRTTENHERSAIFLYFVNPLQICKDQVAQ